eukprot:CAMPEP_0169142868 /NCGR_PEP_ID=MMETSP1015-20121227/45225_1 /TAXON_ID=342587 /ORGANISM="Karlodinium micrum, Strain CCMP2283" /LENGTH=466 /DNA_ID=CAMNT_0009209655 /DNA_START=241 /DNA_END=1641 /DNA_ORIENTATION=+
MTRTSLSKGAVESGADVPCIVMGGVETATSAWSRKLKVSPPLSCKRKGSVVAVGQHVNEADEKGSDESFASGNSGKPSLVTFGDVLASQVAGRFAFEQKVEVKDDHLPEVNDDSENEFENLCMTYEELRGGERSPSDCVAESVLGVMCSHPKSWKLQHLGFRALELLACRKGYKYLADVGSIPVLIGAMTDHRKSEALQHVGCWLLGNIVASSADCRNNVASSGGVQTVIAAMTTHETSPIVHESGCRALKELAALKDSVQEEVASRSGVEVVLKAMDLQVLNSEVQTVACGVLRNMSAGNARHQDRIVSLGGVRKVCVAMVEHSQCAAVQWAGIWTIFCLALQNPASKAEILTNGCISLVLQAMMVHSNEQRVQVAGCWALKELASLIDADSLRSECIQMVSTALSVHCDSEMNKVGRLVMRKLFAPKGNAFNVSAACPNRSMAEAGSHLTFKRRRFADLPTIKE